MLGLCSIRCTLFHEASILFAVVDVAVTIDKGAKYKQESGRKVGSKCNTKAKSNQHEDQQLPCFTNLISNVTILEKFEGMALLQFVLNR